MLQLNLGYRHAIQPHECVCKKSKTHLSYNTNQRPFPRQTAKDIGAPNVRKALCILVAQINNRSFRSPRDLSALLLAKVFGSFPFYLPLVVLHITSTTPWHLYGCFCHSKERTNVHLVLMGVIERDPWSGQASSIVGDEVDK